MDHLDCWDSVVMIVLRRMLGTFLSVEVGVDITTRTFNLRHREGAMHPTYILYPLHPQIMVQQCWLAYGKYSSICSGNGVSYC